MTYRIWMLLATLFMVSCQSNLNEHGIAEEREELIILAKVANLGSHISTRNDNYGFAFAEGDTVDLWIDNDIIIRNYVYEGGILHGATDDDVYYFRVDNRPIAKLYSQWPTAYGREEFPTFQGSEEEYERADWLRAEMTNVQASGTGVPVHYEHQNSRLVFELPDYAGQLTALSLQIGADTYEGFIPDGGNRGELILKPGPLNIAASHINNYIQVNDVQMPLVFTENIQLNMASGYSYVITLTRKGDDLVFIIHIYGFGTTDNNIAVPFTQDEDGYYLIGAEHQLRAARSLVMQYQWRDKNFRLTEDIELTSSWDPVKEGLYSGIFDMNGKTVSLAEGEEGSFVFKL